MSAPSELGARKIIQEAKDTIAGYRFTFGTEEELQNGLAQVLGADWTREHCLSPEDRVDFFHKESGVAMEVKIDHGLTPLTRQVHRYLQHKEVTGLMVVTSKMSLGRIPEVISGKPVAIVTLIGSIL